MSFVAAAVAGGAALIGGVGSAIIQGNAADAAAKKQQSAANQANRTQLEMYNQSRADQEPYRAAGANALSQMADPSFQKDFTAADFTKDPGYDFRMAEGQKAIERGASSRGGLQSGGAMRSIAQYGQNFASNEYGNAYNRFNQDRDRRFGRLSSMAGMGQGAANQNSASAQGYGSQYGSNVMGAANAAGAADIAKGNAWSGAVEGIGQTGSGIASLGMGGKWGKLSQGGK